LTAHDACCEHPEGRSARPLQRRDDADRSGKKKGFLKRLMQSDFAFLENLDNLPGRFIDNANFFAVTDPANVPDAQLFDLMMTEYPGWLQLARRAGMLPS